MKRYLLLFALAACALVCGCSQQPDYLTRVPIFRVVGPEGSEAGTVSIDGKAQYVNFTVLASDKWTAELSGSDAFSLPVSMGGSGSTAVQLKANPNETGASRTVTLTFVLDDSRQVVYKITQQEQRPYLSLPQVSVQVSADGEEVSISVDTNQETWAYDLQGATWLTEVTKTPDKVVFTAPENTTGADRSADILFYAVNAPELFASCDVKQGKLAVAPKADLLDVEFAADMSAKDVSGMNMTVKTDRLNGDVKVKFLDKYNRYAATFNNTSIARSSLDAGYYYIPYTKDSDFGKALDAGYSYECLLCTYQETPLSKQVKMFSATQAGGTGLCFRSSADPAHAGELNFETHVGGGWKELYSSVIPTVGTYYHVIGTWDKQNGLAVMYVNGNKVASVNAQGDFKHMDTNVDARWFGIGADPNPNDKGEASFNGEVVIARLYKRAISADEVKALYKLVK